MILCMTIMKEANNKEDNNKEAVSRYIDAIQYDVDI